MTAYADTGFICSLIAPDANSAAAARRMARQGLPLAWTWLHELEFRNAMRLRVFRKELTAGEADRSLHTQRSDLMAGVYTFAVPEMTLTQIESERLSAAYSSRFGCRSLDILHVAHALSLGLREFLTFDKRQASLAKAAGLNVPRL